jgi:hypothetical protein
LSTATGQNIKAKGKYEHGNHRYRTFKQNTRSATWRRTAEEHKVKTALSMHEHQLNKRDHWISQVSTNEQKEHSEPERERSLQVTTNHV